MDGLEGLAALLFDDIEGLAGLAGSLRDEFDSGFRLTGFLLIAFNEDISPSVNSYKDIGDIQRLVNYRVNTGQAWSR